MLPRLLFAAEIEQFGGAERSLLALSAWLHRRQLDHYLLTYFDHCNLARYASHPVRIVELKPAPGVRNKIASLRQHLRSRASSAPLPLMSGYQAALHATLAGQRGFHDLMHDTPSLFGDQHHRSLAGKLRIAVSNAIIGYGLRSGGTTIVTSEYLRSECQKDFGVDAAIARMGGLATSQPPRIRPANGALNMLSVCRIESNKRIDWLLQALARIEGATIPLSVRADWRLDLVGQGSQIASLRQMAASLGIASRVHFHGFVADDRLAVLYDSAHLFLMPAIQGYGIPAIEALARGIPVLLHRDSGVSDILLDTPWATVLEGGEPHLPAALNTAITNVLDGRHHTVSLPVLPTEDIWAERVAQLCNWLS